MKHTVIKSVFLLLLPFNTLAQGVWNRLDDFPGGGRRDAVSFSIGNSIYVGLGFDSLGNSRNDFWKYNIDSSRWFPVKDFSGTAREDAVAFTINNKAYVGTGQDDTLGYRNDFWEYDPDSNQWLEVAPFPGSPREDAVAFVINNEGYVGTGVDSLNGIISTDPFWKFNPDSNAWSPIADLPTGNRAGAISFSIGNKGYVGCGKQVYFYLNDFWEYDPDSNAWNQISSLPGEKRQYGKGFSLFDKGYAMFGFNNDVWPIMKDVYEYNPKTKKWKELYEFPGERRTRITVVANQEKSRAYIATGYGYDPLKEFWEYYPDSVRSYFPFPDSNTIWSEELHLTKYALLNEDTIIQGKVYHKLYQTFNDSVFDIRNAWFAGAIREDLSTKQILFVNTDPPKEKLIYDFSLKAGDTTTVYSFGVNEHEVVINSVDSILIDGAYRKKLVLEDFMGNYGYFQWIEGIGCNRGLMLPYTDGVLEMDFSLLCFEQNGRMLYQDSLYKSCNARINGMNDDFGYAVEAQIFPNPSTGNFFIQANVTEKATIKIFDVIGNEVYNGVISAEQNSVEINLKNAKGIYLIRIHDGKNIQTKKLVIH